MSTENKPKARRGFSAMSPELLPEWADESDLLNILAEMGVTTLQGTTLEVENEEDEEEDD